jgi:O-antigen/teichoic acid export membrane protein
MFSKIKQKYYNSPVLKNFSVLTGSNILIQLLSILSNIRIARTLTPKFYGEYSLIFVEITLVVVLGAFGLRYIIIRMVARDYDSSLTVFIISSIIRIGSTLLAIAVFALYNIFLGKQYTDTIFFLISMSIIFTAFWEMVENIAFGQEKMEYTGLINLSFTAIWVLTIYVVPKNMFSVNFLLSLFVFFQIIKTSVYFISANKKRLIRGEFKRDNLSILGKDILKQSLPYYFLAIFTLLTNQIPILFLDYNTNSEQVAFFNLGNKLLSPLNMALMTALTALFPNLSKYFVLDVENFNKKIKLAFIVLTGLGIFSAFSFSLFREELVYILYGSSYKNTGNVISYYCWYSVLLAIFSLIGTILGAIDKQKLLATLSVIYAMVATPILWIGSKYGAEELALAFVIAAVLNMTYHWIVFQKVLPKKFSAKYSFLLFISLFIGMAASFAIPSDLKIIFKIICYLVVVSFLIFIYFQKKEKLFAVIR